VNFGPRAYSICADPERGILVCTIAFRTNGDQHKKKNLIMFVTARIVAPAGLPLAEEEEEGLLPPALPEVPAYKK